MPVSPTIEEQYHWLDRPVLIWALFVGLSACVLCFIPLFNLLAFEFAFAISIPLSLGAGILGAKLRTLTSWAMLGKTAALIWTAALLPISANALRVQNCDFLEGLILFALFPMVSTIVSGAWGTALGLMLGQRAVVAFAGLWLGALLLVGWTYYVHPPVDLYSPFLGYWPGAIYDDIFRVEVPLLWSRVEDLVLSIALLSLVLIHRHQYRARWWWTAALITIGLGTHIGARQAGVYRDAGYVQKALGGERITSHLEIYYPDAWSKKRIDSLAVELEFIHAELTAFFGAKPQQPIAVYLYADQRMKKQLMGARRTAIAKPWQWAFHVDRPAIDRSVLVHEMAHVFAARFSDSFLRVPTGRWSLPNMALIEGIAEAATWRSGALGLHEWSAALHRIGIAPPINHLLMPDRFYGQNARTAYTLCGSLYRYVHETQGQAAVQAVYRTGDFAQSTGMPVDELVRRWLKRLNSVPLSENALTETRARFDRPAIFGRVCARKIAALRKAAAQAAGAGQVENSLKLYDEILGHLPRDISSRIRQMKLHLAAGNMSAAKTLASTLSSEKTAGGSARSVAREALGDIALHNGQLEEARSVYAQIENQVFSRGRLRQLRVKQAALSHPDPSRVIEYLYGRAGRKQRLKATNQLIDAAPDWPVGRYLRGRVQLGTKDAQSALQDLKAMAHSNGAKALRFESWRLMAAEAFKQSCYRESAKAYRALAESQDFNLTESERRTLARWARRALFFEAKDSQPPARCSIEIDIVGNAPQDSALDGNTGAGRPVQD